MELYYIWILILAIAFGIFWKYFRLKTMSARQMHSDYSLEQKRVSLRWTQFILPTLLIISGLLGQVDMFIISMGTGLFISTIVEWMITRKFIYNAYVISGNCLLRNGFKLKEFNLQELAMINFLPFSDSLKLEFKDGQSISIHRPDFDKHSLPAFLKIAIEKSELYVAVSDDAKSKIYVDDMVAMQ